MDSNQNEIITDLYEIITDLYEIIYDPINDDPESQYIPAYVKIRIMSNVWFTIDEMQLQDLESLQHIKEIVSDAIYKKNISHTSQASLGGGGNSHWDLTVTSTGIFLTGTISGSGNGCDISIDTPHNEDHLAIFDMLIKLRQCIDNEAKFEQNE